MKQFELSKWLADTSRKVVTRDGRPVRIICWDKKDGEYPIVGLVSNENGLKEKEGCCSFAINGKAWGDACYDLFFADKEEELTEFEKEVKDLINSCCNEIGETIVTNEWAKDTASALLDLARKELEKDHRIIDKDNSDWEDAYEQCKQDILKDFPKWKNITNDGDFYSHESLEDYLIKDILHPSGEVKERLVLKKTDLETLPKEE